MAQVTLTLRPPPNVDFVHGFAGIPPAQDRPQAVVKGALEVRLPPGTPRVKAKWVRIELRKIEQLPGGGPDSQFFDFVGQSPLNLWTTPDEYGELASQDFPFAIRIPESIPPSVELDNRGHISYELVASICTKGKKGFLRKAKAVVKDARAPITIDKHELHSTWPIYCQYEIRHTSHEGLTLTVERNQSCFGPGDRIAVTATVKSDATHTVVITGFELALREVTRLHPNNFVGVKRVPMKATEKVICSQRMESNATLYGGSQATVDLYCTLNPSHTTPTLTSARHMDINYTCIVKAYLQNGSSIVSEIPVMISNWPRSASAQAIKQIGPTLNLSNGPGIPQSLPANARPAAPPAQTTNTMPLQRPSTAGSSNNQFHTAPTGFSNARTDEFGHVASGRPTTPPTQTAAGGSKTSRFTLTNAPELTDRRPISQGRNQGRPGSGGKQWPSAEEEKRAYEEARNRVANTQGPEAAPLPINTRFSPPTQSQGLPSQNATGSGSGGSGSGSGLNSRAWLTAEEEKVQLYKKAQEAALKHQDPTAFVSTPPVAAPGVSSSRGGAPSGSAAGGSSGTSTTTKLSPAEMYRQAMEATQKNAASKLPPASGGGSGSANPPKQQYLSAEQEKLALRRYEEARRAVDRTHGGAPSSAPVAYDALYPDAAPEPPVAAAAPPPSSSPPPFAVASGGPIAVGPQAILSEKERLRREYEARDAAALAAQKAPPPHANEPPPPPFSSGPSAPTGAAILSEKERLRREYEARDAAAQQQQQQQAPPPFTPAPPPTNQYASAIAEKEALRRKFEERDRLAAAAPPQQQQPAGGRSTPAPLYTPQSPPVSPSGGARPIPTTPPAGGSGSGSRILTAAEEKALLKAKYEAKDAAANGTPQPPPPRANANGVPSLPPHTFASPPPLMPKPPAEYIQETREEDDRVSRTLAHGGGHGN